MSQYANLNQKLKNIFQIDRPDLDFGIYRILNARRNEISDYLDNRLKAKVETYLKDAKSDVHDSQLESITNQIKDEFGKRAFDEAGNLVNETAIESSLGQQYQELRDHADSSFDQAQVFSHLYTFFSRYYDEGDFISQRRYKGDTYAIPYSGEEVMLHWANKDQYYTKSGEMFSNYRIRFNSIGEPDKSVLFRLLSADTAKDNQKDNDKSRRFVILSKPKTLTRTDEEGEEYEEIVHPIELNDAGDELTVWFEYAVMDSKAKQDKLNLQAHDDILDNTKVTTAWATLLKHPEPTEKQSDRDLLRKHLDTYTQKNTADYFIHKDLGKFLNNELDFYIKNEVMHLDDVVNSSGFIEIERQLALIKCLRKIGRELIEFLASLENFQKKLWLKKKFVVSSHYCITLDRVDEALYSEIADNEIQWQQWESLGFKVADDSLPYWGSSQYLEEHPYLMVDTSLFELGFKAKLLNSIDDLDEQTDGLIIHSDNFQALSLIQEKYSKKIDCVHIDPPYNTETSGFLYKNNYRHSSWLTFMNQNLSLTKDLVSANSFLQCHIDENEYESLFKVISDVGYNSAGTIVWDKQNPMLGRKGVATQHEYVICCASEDNPIMINNPNVYTALDKAKLLIDGNNGKVDQEVQKSFSSWVSKQKDFSGGDKAYKLIEDDGRVFRGVAMGAPEYRKDPKFHIPLVHPVTGMECPVPPNGWSRTPETLQDLIDNNQILWGKDHTTQPQKKVYINYDSKKQISSIIQDATSGKKVLDPLNLSFPYSHPTSLYNVLHNVIDSGSTVLDFFAGSGTTAHSLIDLYRLYSKQIRYILVEQGEHFHTTLKPRIQKIVYSEEWRSGVPTISKDSNKNNSTNPCNGISHCLKIVKLESYEDTLNNLELKRSPAQNDLFADLTSAQQDDYLMHYMLNIESKDSLLNVADFANPFDYQLKITADSAGAYTVQNVDLIDTFNYLIGLKVRNIDYQLDRGFVQVDGHLRTGELVTVFWRDCEQIGYDELDKTLKKLRINALDSEYQQIYVNGDHNINTKLTSTDGSERQLKVRSIEQVFLERMFAE
ncbi:MULTISPECIES: site-specific DNA-methyltransferase [unclassified Psychrobacter]|uniref:site-specific DNA-methyltransferase n=1 Tax=unclassified Psychrobacter TaxID=196806 RepID=UPI003F451939